MSLYSIRIKKLLAKNELFSGAFLYCDLVYVSSKLSASPEAETDTIPGLDLPRWRKRGALPHLRLYLHATVRSNQSRYRGILHNAHSPLNHSNTGAQTND